MRSYDNSHREEAPSGVFSLNPFGFAGKASVNLIISAKQSMLPGFHELLQTGFVLICTTGVSIRSLLCNRFGFSPQFVEDRISTIFLNGKPVDNIDTTTVADGATIALSGAMPGLAGATLRRKSPLASFRQTISSPSTPREEGKAPGAVLIKVFNILMDELGPLFLRQGMFLPAETLKLFFRKQPVEFWEGCVRILVNDTPVYLPPFREKVLAALKIEDTWVHLMVHGES
ncbi:hypothetical protein [Syntrophorhabdus aromaticivorans]|uniref:Uncharacterized protein n=1 Tax=Syntrophorhabdus aromaticivorans TaxID=328301 RepID=A0A971M580_9BACT|nr:hypothetical protein [Syntrophorhabdus aromaticivorans]NLW35499.1 hypothetical protein [Syntrophorhabdus aromaticivorans]